MWNPAFNKQVIFATEIAFCKEFFYEFFYENLKMSHYLYISALVFFMGLYGKYDILNLSFFLDRKSNPVDISVRISIQHL